jgi:hypothetical protein
MARTAQDALRVGVDVCRVRLQTGEPIVFVDARKDASGFRIAGSVRLAPDAEPVNLPCHKTNFIVVYCA